MEFTLLKSCIRGKAGEKAIVHPDDVAVLSRNGVINPDEHLKKAHTSKAEVKAPKKSKAK